jgi:DNA-directed RNA polymerase subunit omega
MRNGRQGRAKLLPKCHLTKNWPAFNLPLLFSPIFPGTFVFNRSIMTAHLLEEAAKKIPVPQVLINVVSRRVRQLSAGHRPLIETTPRMGFSDIALTEIIEGKLAYNDAPAEEKPPAK